jgi:hypothetical protein
MGIYQDVKTEKTNLHSRISEHLAELNNEEHTTVTYLYLAQHFNKPQRAVNSAIKAMPLKDQVLVVDRETNIPSKGFWAMRIQEMEAAKEENIEERINKKEKDIIKRHQGYRMMDGERKTAKAAKRAAVQEFCGF